MKKKQFLKIFRIAMCICLVTSSIPIKACDVQMETSDEEYAGILQAFGFPKEIINVLPEEDVKEIGTYIEQDTSKVSVDTTYMEVDALSELKALISMSEKELQKYGITSKDSKCIKEKLAEMGRWDEQQIKKECNCDAIEAKMIKMTFEDAKKNGVIQKPIKGKCVTSAGEISTSKMTFTQSSTNNSTSKIPKYTIRIAYCWKDPFWWNCFSDKIVSVWGGGLATSNISSQAKYIANGITYDIGKWEYNETTINGALEFTSLQAKEVSTGQGLDIVAANNNEGYCKYTISQSKRQGYKSKAKSQYFHKRVGLSSDVTLSVTTSGISGGVSTKISGMYDHSDAKYSDITY